MVGALSDPLLERLTIETISGGVPNILFVSLSLSREVCRRTG
jgi:hypothetical protein